MEQISFSDADYAAKKKVTRREKLLLEMEQIVPWQALLRLIEPLYPVAGRGRRPYACQSMLRIHLMQHWFTLSDPGMEDTLYEIESMRRFAGIELHAIPDETTILNFRRFIEDNDLSVLILDKVNQHLSRQGLLLKTGTIVDATIIAAPCSTKNESGERDPEMHQTKKGNQWYFGMKAHIGVDASSGLVHTVVTSAANEADVNIADELLHGKEQTVHADAGYTGADKLYPKKGRTWHIAIKRGKIKKMAEGEQKDKLKEAETAKASIRARVEHPFHTLKCVFGYTKARFKGLVKNTSQIVMLFALGNLHRARKKLLEIKEQQQQKKQPKAVVRLKAA
jgi:transposase, IS5 family